MKKFVGIFIGIIFTAAVIGGFYLFEKRAQILRDVLNNAEQFASELIGTQVKVGNAFLTELNISSLLDSAIILNDIEIFDKNSELIAKVDKAEVTFKLLNFYDEGAGAVDEINITGAQGYIKKRDDNSWNLQDIKIKDTGESTFGAKINLREGTISADFDGKNISVEEIFLSADCADMNAIETSLQASSQITASGTLGLDRQIINASIDAVDILEILPYVPKDILPENISIYGGTAENIALNILRRGNVLSYSGFTNFDGGAVKIEDTIIHDINGYTTFTDAEYNINATFAANGQNAAANGKIRTDTDEIFFDLNAESNYFVPAAIIENIGIEGGAAFTAHAFGTVKDPKVEAKISSDYLAYENISARRYNFCRLRRQKYFSRGN